MRTYRHRVAGDSVTVNVTERGADLDAFRVWFESAASGGHIALDTETTGLDIYSSGYGLRLVQFGDAHTAWVIPFELGGEFAETARWALRQDVHWLIHNATFDWQVLDRHAGIPVELLAPRTTDTQIMARLIDPRQPHEGGQGTSLKPLSALYVDPSAPDTQEGLTAVFRSLKLTKATGWAGIDLWHPTYNLYAGLDVILTARLFPCLERDLERFGVRPALSRYEHEIARICSIMSRTGMILDEEYTRSLDSTLSERASEHANRAAIYGVDNVNSTVQIADALSAMGESLTDRTAGGAVKVDKAVLSSLSDLSMSGERLGVRVPNPLAEAVLIAKRSGKWRQTYVQTFLDSVSAQGRIHPNIHTMAARTGRMSITKPAVQTLPSGDQMIRRCLLAEPGHVMISTDFAAVELRVLAALADVKQMKRAIADGEDLHSFTARMVFGPDFTPKHRKISKGIAFGKVYGGGADTIQRQTGAPMAEVRAALAAYDRVYPEVKRASNRWQREAYNNGMVFESAIGRRLPLDRDRTYAVVNYACQSVARDCLGQALIEMESRALLPHLRLPIHDEVLASVALEDSREVAREIADAMTFDLYGVRIDAESEIGRRSWGSLYGADV